MKTFEPWAVWEIVGVTFWMQIDVSITRLDTYNQQIDAVCLNYNVTIIIKTLLLL